MHLVLLMVGRHTTGGEAVSCSEEVFDMAVLNTLRERPWVRPLLAWTRKYAARLGSPIFAVVLAVLIGAIVILFTSPGSLGDRLGVVVNAYSSLWSGSFGS